MPSSTLSDQSLSSPGRLIRSRLGRRLLVLFVGCALLPTLLVAYLSFESVTRQLAKQGEERLTALTKAVGATLQGRLTFFESDLRREVPALLRCAPDEATTAACGDALLYAAEDILVFGDSVPRELEAPLVPGQSALVVPTPNGELRLYLVHRPEGDGEARVVARLSVDYLWNTADQEGLPGRIALAVIDPHLGPLLGSVPDPDQTITAAWTLPQQGEEALQLPRWQVVLSEPLADVFAPIAGFTRTFPVVLALSLLVVVVLCLIQIRRNLVPLGELVRGTHRVAAGDFHTPVRVGGDDELAALGGAFNTMAARLDRQFRALETAAEIDRAILSTVDAGTIAQTVLERVPEICPCEAVSLTVLEPDADDAAPEADQAVGTAATTWAALGVGEKNREGAGGLRTRTRLTGEDISQAMRQPEWLGLDPGIPVPGYLAGLAAPRGEGEGEAEGEGVGEGGLVACPLHQSGDLLGVLALRMDPGRRSNESLLDLRRLADRVAVALANARMIDRVRVLAFYDNLTRLPNRILYRERLGQAIGRAQRDGGRVGVCSLDLDHFGRINDTLGHAEGDRLIQEVGARLLAACRQESGPPPAEGLLESGGIQVARLGGDEFAVVLPELATTEAALWAARRLLTAFQQPFRLGSQEVVVTGSIGIAVFPEDGSDTETLHKNADAALSHAKREGRNTIEPYSASMNVRALERMQLEHQLRRAVEQGEFTLWYQPIVDLRTRWATGAEALVRWIHPERGLVSPGEFIQLCEESGLIVPLGEWTLRTVCAQARRWTDEGLGGVRFSVNLSARQLRQRGIVRTVQDILDETGARPSDLSIELTESLLMEQGGTIERRIRELAELGVSLAIDDFGTGYSSLSYLKHFPVSTLKIDRSFIEDVTESADAAAITTAIIALARAMELDVVAEGVETRRQATFLRSRGCQKGQGYFLGRPAPVDLFTGYLRARQGRRASA